MNLINFTHIYVPKSTLKWMITFVIITTIVNMMIHQINPDAVTIAEDMSGLPGIALKYSDGGVGFDYRLAMGIPDFFIKYIKEVPDEYWKVGHIF